MKHVAQLIIDPTLPTLSNLSNDTLPTLKERDRISKPIQIVDGKEHISHLVSSNDVHINRKNNPIRNSVNINMVNNGYQKRKTEHIYSQPNHLNYKFNIGLSVDKIAHKMIKSCGYTPQSSGNNVWNINENENENEYSLSNDVLFGNDNNINNNIDIYTKSTKS
eukprot:312067_1